MIGDTQPLQTLSLRHVFVHLEKNYGLWVKISPLQKVTILEKHKKICHEYQWVMDVIPLEQKFVHNIKYYRKMVAMMSYP